MIGDHRYRRARELAGLNVGQAARLLGMTSQDLVVAELDPQRRPALEEQLAALYQVNLAWLAGETPQHDYAALAKLVGDRDFWATERAQLAELLAARSRRSA